MFVDQSVGTAITMFMQGTHKERPLTHDLLAHVLRALGAKIDRVVVNDVKDGTYFARLVLSAENETQQKKIIEIDARPSDCIAMATQQLAPIFVSLDVWDGGRHDRGAPKAATERPGYGTGRRGRRIRIVTSENDSDEILTLNSDAFESSIWLGRHKLLAVAVLTSELPPGLGYFRVLGIDKSGFVKRLWDKAAIAVFCSVPS